MSASVVVSEVFGPTFQGEGPSLGARAAFVRLGGCNLHCSWCDTPYTWDASRFDLRAELTREPVANIVERVAAMRPAVVVVSGGEPLLWQNRHGWSPLIAGLAAIAPVEVETNGTIEPDLMHSVRRYNVSPKLAHSGDTRADRIKPAALVKFAKLARASGGAILKVVVKTPDDIREAAELAQASGWPAESVWIMPEGTDTETLLSRHAYLAGTALAENVNMTTRLHVLTWGSERAR